MVLEMEIVAIREGQALELVGGGDEKMVDRIGIGIIGGEWLFLIGNNLENVDGGIGEIGGIRIGEELELCIGGEHQIGGRAAEQTRR